MKAISLVLVCVALLAGVGYAASTSPSPGASVPGAPAPAALADVAAPGATWRARAADNVCGLSDLRMLSNPAVVRFEELLKATSEMKKLVRDGIDPSSPEGVQLRNAARARVTKVCQTVRTQRGHCSVWRKITHSTGKKATDITAFVRAKL